MTERSPRDRAIERIYSLRKLAEHPNTGDGERAAALAAIERLQAKYDISPPRPKADPPPRQQSTRTQYRPPRGNPYREKPYDTDYDFLRDMREAAARKAARDRDAAERAKAYEAERRRRAEAQARYEQRVRYQDHLGRERLTEEEREWARRDPLGFAASRDKRSHHEKVRDMNEAWGRSAKAANEAADAFSRMGQRAKEAKQTKCPKPESFFDAGGNPRKRNVRPVQCDRCSTMLAPGEGMVYEVAGRWFGRCCEQKPGPRRKRF